MSSTRYMVSWWHWNKSLAPQRIAANDYDPVDDTHEVEQDFDYPHEARMFAQAKANEIERKNLGPWYSCIVVEQVSDESGRNWHDVEDSQQQIESRSRAVIRKQQEATND